MENNAMFVYPTWKEASLRYNEYLRKLNQPVVIHKNTFKSGERVRGARLLKMHKTKCNMTSTIALAVGAKVMLVKNQVQIHKLYNGSLGTVIHIQLEDEQKIGVYEMNEKISYVIVDFHEYCGPVWCEAHPTWVPVPVVEEHCSFHNCCSNHRLPLQINKVSSIHKMQGATVGEGQTWAAVCINFGDGKRLQPGQAYVAVTRPQTLKAMAFETQPDRLTLNNIGKTRTDERINSYQEKVIEPAKKKTKRKQRMTEQSWRNICSTFRSFMQAT